MSAGMLTGENSKMMFQNDEDNRKDFAVSAKRSVGSLKFGQET